MRSDEKKKLVEEPVYTQEQQVGRGGQGWGGEGEGGETGTNRACVACSKWESGSVGRRT